MKSMAGSFTFIIGLTMASALWLSGCGKPAGPIDGGPVAVESQGHHAGDGHDHGNDAHSEHDGHDHGSEGHTHSGWWCGEHGIPEAECSMCSAKVAAEFQRQGDWCQEHDRAESQCFVCHPENKEKYAAKYRAKYGKEPPAVTDTQL